MNAFTARIRRSTRTLFVSLSLLTLLVSVCLAEGWGNVKPPAVLPSTVTSTSVVYLDGSELTATGNYTKDGVTYSVPAARCDIDGTVYYSEGTTFYPDGTWVHVAPNNGG